MIGPEHQTSAGSLRRLALWAASCMLVLLTLVLLNQPSAVARPGVSAAPVGADRAEIDNPVDFNRDIRPIISNNCYQCHGPDSEAREAGLRLDQFDAAIMPNKKGRAAIVPGSPDQSLMHLRITAADPADRMPPVDTDKKLSLVQIETIRRWIEQGAEYRRHWSFVPPTRPELPAVSDPAWPRNAIDSFVIARLDEAGLSPSPEAERTRLLRRVTLDLTGLPPTMEELDAFLADDSAGAFEQVVNRLLASPRYGEHMARYWLDAARYGDTHGLHLDNYREMWRWRDWVISAYTQNMPFDQFTIEQLAGDLLPEPTIDQLIATGFNRNHVSTNEGGAIPEEYLVKYAVDRVETTSTVWMGLTAGCAACHDHKFDPITQREFYQFLAFFNNVEETGMDGNQKDPPPVVRAPTEAQRMRLQQLEARVATLQQKIDAPDPIIDAAQAEWEDSQRNQVLGWWIPWTPTQSISTGGATLTPLADGSVLAGGANPEMDDYIFVGETDLTGIQLVRLEALTHPSLPHTGPGRADNANLVLTEFELVAVSTAEPSKSQSVHFRRALADFSQVRDDFPVRKAIDGITTDNSGWAVAGYERREDRTAVFITDAPFGYEGGTELRFTLRHQSRYPQHTIGRERISLSTSTALAQRLAEPVLSTWREAGPFPAEAPTVESAASSVFEPERHPKNIELNAVYADGVVKWVVRPGYADGQINNLADVDYAATYLYRTIDSPTARTATISLGSDDACVLWVNGERVFEQLMPRAPAPDQDLVQVQLEPGANHILLKVVDFTGGFAFYFKLLDSEEDFRSVLALQTLAIDPTQRTAEQAALVRTIFRKQHSPETRILYEQLEAAADELAAFQTSIPTTLVMKERMQRRETHVLNRGNYDQPKDEVQPGVPACLPPLSPGVSADRLALARWLVSPDHPLTARVTVNRLWQRLFGTGLVETSEDFGSQGAAPTHPELLDWLAVEFVESGWDMQHMLRLMVTSSTYRQTARVTPDRLKADPPNRLYSRAPRFRMDAEMIRDLALDTSGLLVEQIGGPSVRPYQPEGIWEAVAYPDSDTRSYIPDEGQALYRRSLYTFWKRTQPPPNLATFDAPTRESCTVRRPRTNTPLQMLALMNDPQFVEASKALGERLMKEGGSSDVDRLAWVFRLVTSREADAEELRELLALHHRQLEFFRAQPGQAAALLDVGDHQVDESLDAAELAAWTTVANIILSLDESITKG